MSLTADREIRVAQIDVGSGGLVPGDEPVRISEKGRLVVVGHVMKREEVATSTVVGGESCYWRSAVADERGPPRW